jgi:hypothetical protein
MTHDNDPEDDDALDTRAPIAQVLDKHADKIERVLEVVEDGHDARDMAGATVDTFNAATGLARTLHEASGLVRTVGLRGSSMRGVSLTDRRARREERIAESQAKRRRAQEAAIERRRKARERSLRRAALKIARAARRSGSATGDPSGGA